MVAVTLRSRRDVLRLTGALLAGSVLGPREVLAGDRDAARTLALYAVNTGERLSVEYCCGGAYRPDALDAASRLLRDPRTDQVHAIDPTVLDQLFRIRTRLASAEPFHVVSGYRSPATNAARRRADAEVASASYHVAGRAVDVFLPGRDLRALRTTALSLEAGGVGYYPLAGFVHLDSGPPRVW